ncbi:hypothetical protein [Bradyrhizobium sp. UFLA03-84]|uniref:hypothetical protein n=1 Tax=Bradyrhizobium sp. UFLA03-84 TaxID=418599 RepID=UPI0013042370|nr:hypothetical protein [Bradyrhizobium sp. UFLA03-84]
MMHLGKFRNVRGGYLVDPKQPFIIMFGDFQNGASLETIEPRSQRGKSEVRVHQNCKDLKPGSIYERYRKSKSPCRGFSIQPAAAFRASYPGPRPTLRADAANASYPAAIFMKCSRVAWSRYRPA